MSTPQILKVRGETLLLHPDRAVLWQERRTLIVADTHFGKSAVFRRNGMAVPTGPDEYDLQRLATLLGATGATRLLVLGDFLHAAIAPDSEEAVRLDAWLAAILPAAVHIIAGNHDRGAQRRWTPRLDWHEGSLNEHPFRFVHQDSVPDPAAPFTLSGHVHPVTRLRGLRKMRSRIPVFWQRQNGLVLPAFGLFTGGQLISPGPGERLFAPAAAVVVAL